MDWQNYSGLDDTPSLTITVSPRTMALILSAIFYIESRSTWRDYDTNGDAIDAALGDIYVQLDG